jgi:hypothetical protein
MISYPDLNWLAILVAAAATVVIGGLWYAPFAFGNAWMKALGMTREKMEAARSRALPGYVLAIVGSIVTAFVVALTVKHFDATSAMDAVWVAIMMWVGYIVAQQAVGTIFEGRSWTLFGINMANQLVNLLVMALITTLWV